MRSLTRILLLLVICWAAAWGLASALAPPVIGRLLTSSLPQNRGDRVAVDHLTYDRVRVSPSLLGLSLEGISATFDLAPTTEIRLNTTVDAERLVIRFSSPLTLRGDLDLESFEIGFHETDRSEELPFDSLSNGFLHVGSLPLLTPQQTVLEVLAGLEGLFLDNQTAGELDFSGDVMVRLDDTTYPAQLYSEQQHGQSRLRFSRSDLNAMVEAAEVDLSSEQIDLISLYPLRVPTLLDITRRARTYSKEVFPDDFYLRDALRHVSWSYLLTREFGSDFALEVTDAQETRSGNTPNERVMDFHNNAVGRRMAMNGIGWRELPQLVRQHSDVIRHPDEVDSRTDLLR